MTAQNFMNVVRFKLKSDCVDKYFEIIDQTSFEGMIQRYIAKTGDYDYCFVGIWKSAEAIAAQRPAMIAHLDEVRGFISNSECLLSASALSNIAAHSSKVISILKVNTEVTEQDMKKKELVDLILDRLSIK